MHKAHAFFTYENRQYSFWEFEEGRNQFRYVTPSLAVAFDGDTLQFMRLGPVSEVLEWGRLERLRLESEGYLRDARNLTSYMIHREHRLEELNKLAADSDYLTVFLQKSGVI